MVFICNLDPEGLCRSVIVFYDPRKLEFELAFELHIGGLAYLRRPSVPGIAAAAREIGLHLHKRARKLMYQIQRETAEYAS